jgi:hypothetical protein
MNSFVEVLVVSADLPIGIISVACDEYLKCARALYIELAKKELSKALGL